MSPASLLMSDPVSSADLLARYERDFRVQQHDPEVLLSLPDKDEIDAPKFRINRPPNGSKYSDKFKIKERRFTQQYANIYFARLAVLKPEVCLSAKDSWERHGAKFVDRIVNVKQVNDLVYIVGTMYLDQPLKPNILKEISTEFGIIPPPVLERYASAEDEFILEDDSGRIKLIGPTLDRFVLLTGMVVGVVGHAKENGEFLVDDVLYPGLGPKAIESMEIPSTPEEFPTYIAFISGLQIGSSASCGLETQLLFEYLCGEIGTEEEERYASRITKVVIAGDSLAILNRPDDKKPRNAQNAQEIDEAGLALRRLDSLLADLCMHVNVDIIPGATDPANYSLPQQAMNAALFPKAASLSTLSRCTNPYNSSISGHSIVGTAGQNLTDAYRYGKCDSRIKIAEAILSSRHLAPTAPDTLACYPFFESDPFIMQECPSVLFFGNQPEFETSLVQGSQGQRTRIILIPAYSEKPELVLVRTDSLDVELVEIRAW